ncbi:MAG: PAS domain S-box protein [Rhodocyclaceae bacterium]|nr:PAS domain S-box protein [Rhodocyclaceae bacterium]
MNVASWQSATSPSPPVRQGQVVVTAPSREEEPAVLVLDGQGRIAECDRRGESLFGYACSELVGRHVSLLIPELAELELFEGGQPNARLRYRSRIGYRFFVTRRDGEQFPAILFLNCLDNAQGVRLSLLVRRA